MIRLISKYFFHAVILLLLQVFVMNNIALFNMFRPFIYILIVLFLPTGVPRIAVLFIGFASGFIIDIFTLTYGMHTSAAVLVAFSRQYILKSVMEDIEPEGSYEPLTNTMGLRRFTIYVFLSLFIHQVVIHFMQSFGFGNFLFFLLKTLVVTVLSLLFILFYELLVFPGKRNPR
jgi:rod shape-determining protein MreD